jgi:hypothetical protein
MQCKLYHQNSHFVHAWTNFNWQDIYPTKQWVSFLIKAIWIQFYQIWKLRSATIHDNAEDQKQNYKCFNLNHNSHFCKMKKSTVNSSDAYIFDTPIEIMKNNPVSTIQKWICTATIGQKHSKTRKKQQHQKCKIHPYFNTGMTNQDKLQVKPKYTQKHTKIIKNKFNF